MPRRRIDVVVLCSTKEHKVRLNTKRFWASALCPKCRAAVDPTRMRRLLGLLVGFFKSSGGTTLERVLVVGVWTYLLGMLLIWGGLWRLGDRWGPMTVLLFGPRWVLLLPVGAMIAMAVRVRKKLLLPLAAAGLVVVGPVMGFNFGWRSWFGGDVSGTPLRIVTFNAQGGGNLDTPLPWIIEETRADIIGFQECGASLANSVRELPDIAWHTDTRDQLCLVSRYPITGTRQLDREHLRIAEGSGLVVAYDLDIDGQVLHLTNLHLDTPRRGLEPVREGKISEGFGNLQSKSVVREIESRQARRWVDANQGSIVVLGDFNLPVESVIYQRNWGDMRNAFSHSGLGFGFTRYAGWIRARIDHIVTNDGVHVVRSFVGPDFGSDHRPMIADLVLPVSP